MGWYWYTVRTKQQNGKRDLVKLALPELESSETLHGFGVVALQYKSGFKNNFGKGICAGTSRFVLKFKEKC